MEQTTISETADYDRTHPPDAFSIEPAQKI
jgi:hypothetical protein